MSRSRRIVVALFALLGLALAVGSVAVWESFQPTVIELPETVAALALSRDGTSVAACGSDLGWIYTSAGGFHSTARSDPWSSWRGDPSRVQIAFSPDDRLVFRLDALGRVQAWSALGGSEVELLTLLAREGVEGAALSPRGDLVATKSDGGELEVRALPSGRLTRRIVDRRLSWVGDRLGFSPSGDLIFGGYYVPSGLGEHVLVWSVAGGRLVSEGEQGDLKAVLDPGNLYIWTALSGTLCLGPPSEREKWTLESFKDRILACSRDGQSLAFGGTDVELRSLDDGKLLRRLLVSEGGVRCRALTFSGDGSRLAAAFGRRIHVWRLRR